MQTLLSPDQSRAARRELALSQKDVIAQTGIAAYKLKQFESGSFRPDLFYRLSVVRVVLPPLRADRKSVV